MYRRYNRYSKSTSVRLKENRNIPQEPDRLKISPVGSRTSIARLYLEKISATGNPFGFSLEDVFSISSARFELRTLNETSYLLTQFGVRQLKRDAVDLAFPLEESLAFREKVQWKPLIAHTE